MGMDLRHGGHLTHGSPANFSGKLFRVVSYGVNRETETIDLEDGVAVDILNLQTLIDLKATTGRDKDIAMLSILRAMLNER